MVMFQAVPALWSPGTVSRLRQAGWFPGRDASVLVGPAIQRAISAGWQLSPVADEALRSLGGITISLPPRERGSLEPDSLTIDPLLAMSEDSTDTWPFQRPQFPFGGSEWEEIFVCEDGRVVRVAKTMSFCYPSVVHLIEAMVAGVAELGKVCGPGGCA